jgi:hypothetical protein
VRHLLLSLCPHQLCSETPPAVPVSSPVVQWDTSCCPCVLASCAVRHILLSLCFHSSRSTYCARLCPVVASRWPQFLPWRWRQSNILDIPENRCLSLWPVDCTDCSAIMSAICKWLQQISVRPCGWWVGFPHSSAISQTNVSSVKLCYANSEVECCYAVHNKTALQWFMILYASQNHIMLKTNWMFMCSLIFFCIFILGISQVVGTKQALASKWIFTFANSMCWIA